MSFDVPPWSGPATTCTRNSHASFALPQACDEFLLRLRIQLTQKIFDLPNCSTRYIQTKNKLYESVLVDSTRVIVKPTIINCGKLQNLDTAIN